MLFSAAAWTNFGAWSACTHTCHPVVAGGCPRMVRRRYCDNGAVGFPGCDGEELESKVRYLIFIRYIFIDEGR